MRVNEFLNSAKFLLCTFHSWLKFNNLNLQCVKSRSDEIRDCDLRGDFFLESLEGATLIGVFV